MEIGVLCFIFWVLMLNLWIIRIIIEVYVVMKLFFYFGLMLKVDVFVFLGLGVIEVVCKLCMLCVVLLCVVNGYVGISFEFVIWLEDVGVSIVCFWLNL